MIIKVIPETDAERERVKEVEHRVKSFMIFGTEVEEDGDLRDFHDWDGQYPELIGKTHYYSVLLENEFARSASKSPEVRLAPPASMQKGMIKTGEVGEIEVFPQEVIDKITKAGKTPDLKIIEAKTIETDEEKKETEVVIEASEPVDD